MFERGLCIFVACLSLIGVAFTSKHIHMEDGVQATFGTSNYMDVYFKDVSSSNGSNVSLTDSRRSFNLDSISLSKVGETEVIRYELYNNSYSYNVDVDVMINGENRYENEFFIMETSAPMVLKSGQSAVGEIRVTLKKAVLDSVSVPFDVELVMQPNKKNI